MRALNPWRRRKVTPCRAKTYGVRADGTPILSDRMRALVDAGIVEIDPTTAEQKQHMVDCMESAAQNPAEIYG